MSPLFRDIRLFRIEICMRIAHDYDDSRVPEQLLHRHYVDVFCRHPRIRNLWDTDCRADSYYGFRPGVSSAPM